MVAATLKVTMFITMSLPFFGWQCLQDVLRIGLNAGDGEHDLSWPGFLLLVEAAKGLDRIPLPILKVDVRTGFLRIAAYAARQVEPIESLSINEVNCESLREGQACVGLLQQSQKWAIEVLRLTGSVGELFWEGLATSMASCKFLEKIRLSKRVMTRGSPDHLRRVWCSTSVVWCQRCKK